MYSSWEDCKRQTDGVVGAQFKSFPSLQEAEQALKQNYWAFVNKEKREQPKHVNAAASFTKKPVLDSIAVDGAHNGATLESEYQGVYIKTGERIFLRGPYKDGTNNIMEFLAIVHALAYCKQKNSLLPIYSDSLTALSWVSKKKAKTKLELTKNNAVLFDLIERAEKWLRENTYTNKLLKWETELWGENPADFGRK